MPIGKDSRNNWQLFGFLSIPKLDSIFYSNSQENAMTVEQAVTLVACGRIKQNNIVDSLTGD